MHMIQYSLMSISMHVHLTESCLESIHVSIAELSHDTWLCSYCKGVYEEVQPTQQSLLLLLP